MSRNWSTKTGRSGRGLRNLLLLVGGLLAFKIVQGYLQYAPMSELPAAAPAAPDPAPEYARPLPPGGVALRLVEPGTGPDLAEAWRNRDSGLLDSLEESLEWYAAPSSRTKFPYEVARPGGVRSISHAEAQASVAAFRDLLLRSRDAAEFERMVRNRFEVYESIGWDGTREKVAITFRSVGIRSLVEGRAA